MSSIALTQRPTPCPDADSRPFWAACAEGRLLGQRCGRCGAWRWPPREHCAQCHAAAPAWVELSGDGVVLGAVVIHRPFDPAFADDLPLTIVHVEMDGAERQMVLIGALASSISAQRATGARVTVGFKTIDGGALPVFKIIGEHDVG